MASQPAEHSRPGDSSALYELEFPAPSVSKDSGTGPVLVHALDGFADAGNLTRAFKRWEGMSPTSYRGERDTEH